MPGDGEHLLGITCPECRRVIDVCWDAEERRWRWLPHPEEGVACRASDKALDDYRNHKALEERSDGGPVRQRGR